MRDPIIDSKSAGKHTDSFRASVLAWYDNNARTLPWRAVAGQEPNPYHVWLSEIMLQQTVVAAVIPYFQKFVDKWPTVHDLAKAPEDEVMSNWAGLGYYARARNLIKCAQIISSDYKGEFPSEEKELQKLPGIGTYTSAAIRAIAFNKPANVVDGNIERIISRYYLIKTPLPQSKPEISSYVSTLCEQRKDRPGDFAQALMDIGSNICIPKSPKCTLCPLHYGCKGYKMGIANTLPRKKAKKAKPKKHGYIYWIKYKNEILIEKRPDKGLLGGMFGIPTSPWIPEDQDNAQLGELIEFTPKELGIDIYHSFTHFDLKLSGYLIEVNDKNSININSCTWLSISKLANYGFPTVFKKFVKLMLHHDKSN